MIRLAADDVQLLEYIERVRAATPVGVASVFGWEVATAEQRLRRLARRGLLRNTISGRSYPPRALELWGLSERGQEALEAASPTPRLSPEDRRSSRGGG